MPSPSCTPIRASIASSKGGMLARRTVASAFLPFQGPCATKEKAYSPFTPAKGGGYASPTPESIERSGGSTLSPPLLPRPYGKGDTGTGSKSTPDSVLLEINSGSSLFNPKARRALYDEFQFEAGDDRVMRPRLDGDFVLMLPSISHSSSGVPGGEEDEGEEDDMPEMPLHMRLPIRAPRARSSTVPRAAARRSGHDRFVSIHPHGEGGRGGDSPNVH